jgi:hypothetical protein
MTAFERNDSFRKAYLIPICLQLDAMGEQGWYIYTCQKQCIHVGQEALVSCACGAWSALALGTHCKKQIEISAFKKESRDIVVAAFAASKRSGGVRNAEAP